MNVVEKAPGLKKSVIKFFRFNIESGIPLGFRFFVSTLYNFVNVNVFDAHCYEVQGCDARMIISVSGDHIKKSINIIQFVNNNY